MGAMRAVDDPVRALPEAVVDLVVPATPIVTSRRRLAVPAPA
jgi:hypothetical protein